MRNRSRWIDVFLLFFAGITAGLFIVSRSTRTSTPSEFSTTSDSAQKTQIAALVAQQWTMMPTATLVPTSSATPSPTPTMTPAPTPFGGAGDHFMITFSIINALRQGEIIGFKIVDLDGATLLEKPTKGSAVSVSNDRTRMARLVENGIEIFTSSGESEVYLLPEVSSDAGVGYITWFPDDSKLLVTYHQGIIDGGGVFIHDDYLVDLHNKTHQSLFSNLINENISDILPDGSQLVMSVSDKSDYFYSLDHLGQIYSLPTTNLAESLSYKYLGMNYDGSYSYWLLYSAWYYGVHELVQMDMTNQSLRAFGQDPDLDLYCVPSKKEEKVFCGNVIDDIHPDTIQKKTLAKPDTLLEDDLLREVIPYPDESKILAIYMDYATQDSIGVIYNIHDNTAYPLDFIVREGFRGWSPDGKLVYSYKVSENLTSTLIFFDTETRKIVKEFQNPEKVYFENFEWVN